MTTAAPPVPTPRRSRRRWVLLGAFAVLLVATPFLYLTIAGWQRDRELEAIYHEMDAEDPSWRWADLIKQLPPAPPDERNAMVQVFKVSVLMKATPFGNPFGTKMPSPANARLRDDDEQHLRAALAALAPNVLAEASKIKDMPEGCILVDPAISAMEVDTNALEILHVMRVLNHAAMMQAQIGQTYEAVDSCLAIAHSTHAIGDFPEFMVQLVRTAGQIYAVDSIERTLGQGIVDDKRLEQLQGAMTIEANHNGLYHALRGELAGGHELYYRLQEGTFPVEKFIEAYRLDRTPQGKLYYYFPRMVLRGYPDGLRWRNKIVRTSNLKDDAQIEAFDEIEGATQKSSNLWTDGFHSGQIKDHRKDHTRVRCAAAALAAERYRLKYDQWPTDIAELMKEGLLQAPITDPYDGQPLRFHRTDPGMIVYSIGPNKVDNRGKKANIAFELWHPNFRAVAAPAELEVPKKSNETCEI